MCGILRTVFSTMFSYLYSFVVVFAMFFVLFGLNKLHMQTDHVVEWLELVANLDMEGMN